MGIIVRKRNSIHAQAASVSGSLLVNNTSWNLGGGTVSSRSSSASGTLTVTPYVPSYIAPSFLTIPTITFQDGVVSTIPLRPYIVQGTQNAMITLSGALPAGVAFGSDSALRYDGRTQPNPPGLPVTATGITLTANDGYGDATDITTLIVHEPQGTAGLVFRKGDIPSGSYVGFNSTAFQVEPRNYWPDGSVRTATTSWSGLGSVLGSPVTVKVQRKATATTGTAVSLTAFRASGFNGSVAFTVGPSPGITGYAEGDTVTLNLATLITGTPHRTWQTGHKCSEWHWRQPVGSDPTLVVWLFARYYADGSIWTRVTVENGYAKVTPQTGKRYHCRITINGTVRYNTATDSQLYFPRYNGESPGYGEAWYWPWVLGDTLPHGARSRWTKQFWYDGRALQANCHDGVYLSATKLFPNYGWRNTPTNRFGLSPQASVPLRALMASYDQKQPSSPMIGHNFDYLYVLAPQGSSYQRAEFHTMIARSEECGHRIAFLRDENTNDPVVWSDRPNLWGQLPGDGNSISTTSQYPPMVGDRAHDPLWGFSAYLCTGDYFHLEVIQQRATWNWMSISYNSGNRDGVKGLLFGGDFQTREFGWTFRTLGAAAVCTPDSDDPTSYFYKIGACYKNSIYYNAERQAQQFIDGSLTGAMAVYNAPNTMGRISSAYATGNLDYWENQPALGIRGEAPWQQNFCSVSMARVEDFEVLTGTQQAMLTRVVNFALSFSVGMLGDHTGWPYNFAAAFNVPIIKNIDGVWTYAQSWGEIYQWFLTIYSTIPDQRPIVQAAPLGAAFVNTLPYNLSGDYGQLNGFTADPASWCGSQWGSLHGVLAAAIDRNLPGATLALQRLRSLTGPTGVVPSTAAGYAAHAEYFHASPLWAEAPRTTT